LKATEDSIWRVAEVSLPLATNLNNISNDKIVTKYK